MFLMKNDTQISLRKNNGLKRLKIDFNNNKKYFNISCNLRFFFVFLRIYNKIIIKLKTIENEKHTNND